MENYKAFTQSLYSLGNIDFSVLLNNCTSVEYVVLSKLEMCMTDENLDYVNVTQLSVKLGVSVPAVSRVLRSLEEKKYIERNVDIFCRRNTRVKLTKAGKKELSKCQNNLDKFFSEIFSDLEETEQKVMAHSFQIMCDRMQTKIKEYKEEV